MSPTNTARASLGRISEWLVPVAGACTLLVACIITSARKYLWHDEVFSWVLVTDPSPVHMLRAIAGGAEAAPPLYHLVARAWLLVAGRSELVLRLWSSFGFALALIVLWRVLRRSYPPMIAAIAAVAPFCTSPLLWYQNAEARFYGTFMLAVALALAATDGAARGDAGERPGARVLLAVAASHAALVMAHIFGFLYSGALLAAVVARDVVATVRGGRSALRWRVYAATAAGWSVFALWIPAFLRQADVGKPHTWIPIPTVRDLRRSYGTVEVRQLMTTLLVIAVLLAVTRWIVDRRRTRESTPLAQRDARPASGNPLPWFAAAILLVPIAAYMISHTFMSVFVDRYLLPGLLATGVIMASSLTAIAWAWRESGAPGGRSTSGAAHAVALVAVVVLLSLPVRWAMAWPHFQKPGAEVLQLARAAGDGTPVVTESPLEYLPAVHYSGAPARPFFFVLDWESALDSAAALQATVDYKMMFNWRRWGYMAAGIVEGTRILCDMPRFVVVDEPGRLWYDRRIATNPAYDKLPLGAVRDTATGWLREKRYWLVTRTSPRDSSCGVNDALGAG